jgi:hypothetical protein
MMAICKEYPVSGNIVFEITVLLCASFIVGGTNINVKQIDINKFCLSTKEK